MRILYQLNGKRGTVFDTGRFIAFLCNYYYYYYYYYHHRRRRRRRHHSVICSCCGIVRL